MCFFCIASRRCNCNYKKHVHHWDCYHRLLFSSLLLVCCWFGSLFCSWSSFSASFQIFLLLLIKEFWLWSANKISKVPSFEFVLLFCCCCWSVLGFKFFTWGFFQTLVFFAARLQIPSAFSGIKKTRSVAMGTWVSVIFRNPVFKRFPRVLSLWVFAWIFVL